LEPIPATRLALEELDRQGDAQVGVQLLAKGVQVTRIVPECFGLSLTLFAEDLTFTLIGSGPEIAALDSVQQPDSRPCVDAAHRGHDDVLAEERWRMDAQHDAAAGVASSLTLPIETAGGVLGTISMYASTADAFEGHHQELGAVLEASAEHAVTNADLSFSTRFDAAKAPTVLADQDDVDIAVGIIAARLGVDIPTAQHWLREAAAAAGITEGQAARVVPPVLHPE
jgi:hypothetical protein